MRICLVTGEYPPQQGGVGDFTHELATALAGLGADVCVLTNALSLRSDEFTRSSSGSPEDERVNSSLRRDSVHRSIRHWDWRCWRELDRALDALQPDVVDIQYQAAAYRLRGAINLWPRLSRWGRRTVVTLHDLRVPYLFPKAGPLRWQSVLALARGCARAIVTNAEDEAVLAPLLKQSPARIPIGANIAPRPPEGYDRAAWRARAGVAPDEIVLAYFGFLNESKGGEELVGALTRLRAQGLPVRLWLIGGEVGTADPTNAAYLARVRNEIAAQGLAPYVRWTGFTAPPEVSANLLAADLAVLPYRDGVSFRRGSLMAALAHGLPVVSTQPRLDIAEIVEGENMALVPPSDAQALAARITALIADPAARQRLGQGALQLAAQFEWGAIARRTLELFETIQ